MTTAQYLQDHVNNGLLSVRVTPGASRTQVLPEKEGVVRIALHAPARDGLANKELERFVKKILKCKVVVIHGLKCRDKTLKLW